MRNDARDVDGRPRLASGRTPGARRGPLLDGMRLAAPQRCVLRDTPARLCIWRSARGERKELRAPQARSERPVPRFVAFSCKGRGFCPSCGSGCSRCPSRCATGLPTTLRWCAKCSRSSCSALARRDRAADLRGPHKVGPRHPDRQAPRPRTLQFGRPLVVSLPPSRRCYELAERLQATAAVDLRYQRSQPASTLKEEVE